MRNISDNIARLNGILFIGLAGASSALVLALIASNRISGISIETTSSFLLLIQWHLLGFTICKFGIDYACFATFSKEPEVTLKIRPLLRFPVLPLSLLYAAITFQIYPPIISIILVTAVVFDVLASFRAAECNARGHWNIVAIGNILNYPVLFILILIYGTFQNLDLVICTVGFALTSLLRYSWFEYKQSYISQGNRAVVANGLLLTGMQGLANWSLFRLDQILILLLPITTSTENQLVLSQYLFLARIPELATGIIIIFGNIYYPKFHISSTKNKKILTSYFVIGSLLGILSGTIAHSATELFNGPDISLEFLIPFCIQIPLILWANMITYSMQSNGHLIRLIINAAGSAVAGYIYFLFALDTWNFISVAWMIPVQLLIFCVVSLSTPWGQQQKTYG